MIAFWVNYGFQIFTSFSIGVLLNDFFDRKCPDEYKIVKCHITNLLLNASYNCLYFYSKCQIFFTKYIAMNPYYSKLMTIIDSIKSTSATNSINIIELLYVKDNLQYNIPCESPDLIIATELSKTPALKKILYNEIVKGSNIVFEESNIKFMLVEFKVGENSYKIDLKTETYNYYIIGNKFTKEFFIYYINEYILTKSEQYKTNIYEKCAVRLIDQDINVVEINFTDKNTSILLEKNEYIST